MLLLLGAGLFFTAGCGALASGEIGVRIAR